MYHVHRGWRFERRADGVMEIRKHSDGREDAPIDAKTSANAVEWVNLFARETLTPLIQVKDPVTGADVKVPSPELLDLLMSIYNGTWTPTK